MNTTKNMEIRLSLLLALLSAILLQATAASAEKIRIIMDTDALAEVDDQHAMAYMLFSGDHFEVEGITVNRGSDGPHRTDRDQDIDDHFREAVNVAKMCASPHVPVLKGPAGSYSQIKGTIGKSTFDGSDAVNFIIQRAHARSGRPLVIYACGNLTSVALALLKDPTIAPKIQIWWLGTEWPQNHACNNHVGDLDAVDALLANPQNVAFHIIPWPNGIYTNHAEIYEKMPGKGPKVSPGVPGRWGGSFTRFGDYSVELFRRGVWSGQKRRSLLDAFGFAVLKNKSWFTPTTMGAPSFKRTDPSAKEKHKYPGEWVANDSNPRRVTFWRDGKRTPVLAEFWDTFNNPVLPRQRPGHSDGGQEPMKIILDTDIDGDIDDVGAMAMLHAMADNGEIEILAVMVSSKHEWSAPAVDVINTYYNRPDIPIGVPKGEGRDVNSRYARQLAEEFPHTLRSNSAAPNAVTLYRDILSRQPDNSVVIVTIGYLTTLHDLLNSKADQYSSLNGRNLAAQKVKRFVCMASGQGNFAKHAEAAVNVVNNWPTLSVHTKGQDFAWSITTGSVLQQTPQNNSVRRAYEHYFNGTARDRHSADQLSLFIAVRGVDPYFRLTTQGYMDVADGTRSDWRNSPDNPLHHWVDGYHDGVDPAVVKQEIEKLMTQPPADSTPRKVTFVDGRASHAQEPSQIHHREHNLLLDATYSGNMDSFNKGLRRFDGGDCQPKFLVYDFKKQDFLDFSRWVHHPTKKLVSKTDWYAYGVQKDVDLGVVPENNAAYWMAQWPAPVSANFITLMGSYPDESSQANTAWKMELRSNGQWRVHAQGVGGWYDRGQYFWGGRGQSPIQFDALRVSLFGKDEMTRLKNIHFRAQENRTWMVAFLPAIDARIAVTEQVPRAGQVVNFVGNQVFGTVQSWQWNFGDGKSATGQTVSHTFANQGTYDVTLTFFGVEQTAQIVEHVTIHPAIEAQITPLSGSVLEGNPVTFDASHSYGAIGTYQWDFGDGSTATGKQVTKSFSKAAIYQVTLKVSNSTGSNSCSALVRVHTPATVNVPQVLLDADVEEDDIYTIAYALYSELDVVGMTAVHHGGEERGAVKANYERILKVIDLARRSGLPAARQPRAFRGADAPLIPPYSDNWRDTEPIVTEASEAILAAARGASADNPVWVVPLGPISNVATAILQARREGWESEFRERIRVCWLGAGNSSTRVATWNGRRDAWAAHIVAQSGIDFLIMPEPVGITLKWDRREMKDRYSKNPLGDYLYQISPDRNAGWYDPTVLAAVISMHGKKDWFSNVEGVAVGDRYQDYRFASTTAPTSVRLIRNIDADAMRNDIFETINGRPTKLRDSASGTSGSRRGTDGGK